jgi:hypothetical protein
MKPATYFGVYLIFLSSVAKEMDDINNLSSAQHNNRKFIVVFFVLFPSPSEESIRFVIYVVLIDLYTGGANGNETVNAVY